MPSDKQVIQNFSNFVGLDVRSSDLTRPVNAAKDISNFIIEQSFALGGERGLKLFADLFEQRPIAGMHVYISKDPVTGRETQELLALGRQLYRLKEGAITLTYSGLGNWDYEFYLDTASDAFKLKLVDDGVTVLNYSVGTGLEEAGGAVILSTLDSAIDAVTNFASTANSTIGQVTAAAFPLVADYNLAPGSVDIPIWYWEAISGPFVSDSSAFAISQFQLSPYINNHNQLEVRSPVFINKNNCCYISCDGYLPLIKYDGAHITQPGVPGMIQEEVELAGVTNSPSLEGSFFYYVRFFRKDAKGNFIYGNGIRSDQVTAASGEAPRLALSSLASTAKGMNSSFRFFLGEDNTTTGESNVITLDSALDDANLEDFYGHTKLKIGDIVFITGDADPTSARRRVSAVDRATNEITFEGPAIDFGGGGVEIYWDNLFLLSQAYFRTSSSQPSVSAITVADNVGVAPGMWLFFPDEADWYQVVSVSGSTITIDGVVSIPSGTYYVSNLAVQIFRTENGGADKFYLSQEIGGDATSLVGYHVDTVADADLREELVFPTKEPDYLREFPSLVTQHQGVMIVAGGTTRSGRLLFEDFEFLESFPLATNFYDVPSQETGILTAIWSDTYDQLAVFKERAYLSVVGNFRDEVAILSTNANSEGEHGVSSQNSLIKIRGLNYGLGLDGLVAFQGGVIDYERVKQLRPEFVFNNDGSVLSESAKLRVHRARAVNYGKEQQAYFFIPAFTVSEGETILRGANENSKMFIVDYSESTITRRGFPGSLDGDDLIPFPFFPTAGMAVWNNRLFFMSNAYDGSYENDDSYLNYTALLFRRKEREVLYDNDTQYKYDYADQHAPISYDYKTGWYSLSVLEDNLYHWLKVFSLPGDDFVPFSLRVRTYIDWDESTVIDDVTLSFTSTTKKALLKLQATKAESLMIRFTTEAVHTKPTLTGFQVVVGDVDGQSEGVR